MKSRQQQSYTPDQVSKFGKLLDEYPVQLLERYPIAELTAHLKLYTIEQLLAYETLNLQPGANEDALKKSFRKLSLKWHPDKNRGNEEEASEKFKEIGNAKDLVQHLIEFPPTTAPVNTRRRKSAANAEETISPLESLLNELAKMKGDALFEHLRSHSHVITSGEDLVRVLRALSNEPTNRQAEFAISMKDIISDIDQLVQVVATLPQGVRIHLLKNKELHSDVTPGKLASLISLLPEWDRSDFVISIFDHHVNDYETLLKVMPYIAPEKQYEYALKKPSLIRGPSVAIDLLSILMIAEQREAFLVNFNQKKIEGDGSPIPLKALRVILENAFHESAYVRLLNHFDRQFTKFQHMMWVFDMIPAVDRVGFASHHKGLINNPSNLVDLLRAPNFPSKEKYELIYDFDILIQSGRDTYEVFKCLQDNSDEKLEGEDRQFLFNHVAKMDSWLNLATISDYYDHAEREDFANYVESCLEYLTEDTHMIWEVIDSLPASRRFPIAEKVYQAIPAEFIARVCESVGQKHADEFYDLVADNISAEVFIATFEYLSNAKKVNALLASQLEFNAAEIAFLLEKLPIEKRLAPAQSLLSKLHSLTRDDVTAIAALLQTSVREDFTKPFLEGLAQQAAAVNKPTFFQKDRKQGAQLRGLMSKQRQANLDSDLEASDATNGSLDTACDELEALLESGNFAGTANIVKARPDDLSSAQNASDIPGDAGGFGKFHLTDLAPVRSDPIKVQDKRTFSQKYPWVVPAVLITLGALAVAGIAVGAAATFGVLPVVAVAVGFGVGGVLGFSAITGFFVSLYKRFKKNVPSDKVVASEVSVSSTHSDVLRSLPKVDVQPDVAPVQPVTMVVGQSERVDEVVVNERPDRTVKEGPSGFNRGFK